jgi:uncharacterized protein (TIGR02598 family)
MNIPPAFLQKRSGFTLVEVTLALGIASFCLVALLGLIPVGLNSNMTAIEQTSANAVLSAIVADLRATQSSPTNQSVTSATYNIAIPPNPVSEPSGTTLYFDSTGRFHRTKEPTSRYRVDVVFPANTSGATSAASTSSDRAATLVNMEISWPAQAARENAIGVARVFSALDRN